MEALKTRWNPTEFQFCSSQNLDECLAFLSKELSILGYGAIQPKAGGPCDLVALLNVTYGLYQDRMHSHHQQMETENRLLRLNSELEQAYSGQHRLQDSLDKMSRALAERQEAERQLIEREAKLQTQLKAEKAETKRLNSALAQRQAQYRHEVRKLERELTHVKEHLGQKLREKHLTQKLGIQMTNTLPNSDGHRSKWKNSSANVNSREELLKQMVASHQSRNAELLEENLALRDLLGQLQDALLLDSWTQQHDCNSNPITSSLKGDKVPEKLPEGVFQLPVSQMGQRVEESLHKMVAYLKKHLEDSASFRGTKPHPSPTEELQRLQEELEVLQNQLGEKNEMVQQQQQFIQRLTTVEGSPEPRQQDGYLVEEFERLQVERQQLQKEKANFAREREFFTESAIRLGRERQELESSLPVGAPPTKAFIHVSPLFTKPNGDVCRLRTSLPNTTPVIKKESERSLELSSMKPRPHSLVVLEGGPWSKWDI